MDPTEECCMCLEPLNNGDEIIKLSPCGHHLHRKCAISLINAKDYNCPLCRNGYQFTLTPPDYMKITIRCGKPLQHQVTPGTIHKVGNGLHEYKMMAGRMTIDMTKNIFSFRFINSFNEKEWVADLNNLDKIAKVPYTLYNVQLAYSYILKMVFSSAMGPEEVGEIEIYMGEGKNNHENKIWDLLCDVLDSKEEKLTITETTINSISVPRVQTTVHEPNNIKACVC